VLFGWDLHPDGERFLVTVNDAPAAAAASAGRQERARTLVVVNWFEELRERMGGRR